MILNAIAAFLHLTIRGALFLAIAVFGGLGTAWALIHSGSRLTTVTSGPWMSWTAAGRMDADPYTRANTVRTARLPINPSLALTWRAENDSDGARIHSSCAYSIDMSLLDAAWWSLAVYDDRGALISNPANRHGFNAATLVRNADGTATIVLARDARPGNWLPTTGAGKVTLLLDIVDPVWVATATSDPPKLKPLPAISRIACR
ncbi:MAG TPA: DUF1214 domain-containing protein [Hyphomicrobiaceae bacterium]|nr:DUF1214 domain-containing protein [Hyphomicrobiaceae bacterium]